MGKTVLLLSFKYLHYLKVSLNQEKRKHFMILSIFKITPSDKQKMYIPNNTRLTAELKDTVFALKLGSYCSLPLRSCPTHDTKEPKNKFANAIVRVIKSFAIL